MFLENHIPMSMYRIVQTGAKTQLGGQNQGLFKNVYHSGLFVFL